MGGALRDVVAVFTAWNAEVELIALESLFADRFVLTEESAVVASLKAVVLSIAWNAIVELIALEAWLAHGLVLSDEGGVVALLKSDRLVLTGGRDTVVEFIASELAVAVTERFVGPLFGISWLAFLSCGDGMFISSGDAVVELIASLFAFAMTEWFVRVLFGISWLALSAHSWLIRLLGRDAPLELVASETIFAMAVFLAFFQGRVASMGCGRLGVF